MNETAAREYDPQAALARSLFGFALAGWLPMCLALAMLALNPSPTQSAFARIHQLAVLGFGALTLLALALTIGCYRLDAAAADRSAKFLLRLLGGRGLAVVSLVMLIELNLAAEALLRDIAPIITEPARFLLFCWSLLFGGILLTVHWLAIRLAILRYRDNLALAFIALVFLCCIGALALLTNRLASDSGLRDQLRGQFDYRPLHFIDDGNAPSAQEFWAEQSQTRVRWLPYSYWVVAAFDGEYIHVDDRGMRSTIQASSGENLPSVYFFGGSTIWGEGARDAYTIPSQLATLLAKGDAPATVRNYGQTGYVSAQDLILFQRQLALGNSPELAVFYQGFNDIYSAYRQGQAGLPLSEIQRLDDAEAGRRLRQAQPILRQPGSIIADQAWQLAIFDGNSPREILLNWLGNRQLIRAAAEQFGVDVLFIWQPALFAKRKLSGYETQFAAEIERNLPGFLQLYAEVDELLRQQAASDAYGDIVFLSDLFAANTDEIFFDEVHINEIGNAKVAGAIADPIARRLAARSPSPRS